MNLLYLQVYLKGVNHTKAPFHPENNNDRYNHIIINKRKEANAKINIL